MQRVEPSEDTRTFAELQKQGLPMKLTLVLPMLKGHVCVLGDVAPLWWTLASGPPAYHFDEKGRLIDFTVDVGDSTLFQKDYDIYHEKVIDVAGLPTRFREAEH